LPTPSEGADQEIIELSLRHDLYGPDLADVLGVPHGHAHALATRARGQLEESLGVLLVTLASREACPDLDQLLADLPASADAGTAPAISRGPGRFAIALKSSVRRSGRWRVPDRYTTVVYKGSGWLDLRAAELSGPATAWAWRASAIDSSCW